MGILDDLKKWAHPYEDEDEEYAAEGAEGMEPPEPRHRFRRRNASEKQAGPVLGTLAVLGYKLRRAMLAGEAAAVEDEVELLAFCDSTHIAPRDFIRRLVAPVVDGEDFSTGYHKVVARDTGIVTMAYALCVQLMRYLQGISSFTQLWGGAMCFRLSAFRSYGVREFWMSNVVDDCSLADRLIHHDYLRAAGHAVLDDNINIGGVHGKIKRHGQKPQHQQNHQQAGRDKPD